MKIRELIPAYNGKRYAPPWAANISLDERSLNYIFNGLYLGNVGGGTITIDANPGDVIAIGQKDERRLDKSTNDLFIIKKTGELDYCTKDEAIYYLLNKTHNR